MLKRCTRERAELLESGYKLASMRSSAAAPALVGIHRMGNLVDMLLPMRLRLA